MKKILKWIGIIVLVLIVIGALSGNKGGSTSKTGTTSNKISETPKMAGLNETAQEIGAKMYEKLKKEQLTQEQGNAETSNDDNVVDADYEMKDKDKKD